MNVLSLFAGIGGLDLGLERAGMTVIGQVEIDPFCRDILADRWPEVPQHDNVRTAATWWRSQQRPPVHVVAGGFPCQPFSTAGRLREGEQVSEVQPQPGDKVRVTFRPRSIYTHVDGDGLYQGMGDVEDGRADVEILERADDPSRDEIGTVAELNGSVWIKRAVCEWSTIPHYREQWRGDEKMRGRRVTGAVPGTPADEAQRLSSPSIASEYAESVASGYDVATGERMPLVAQYGDPEPDPSKTFRTSQDGTVEMGTFGWRLIHRNGDAVINVPWTGIPAEFFPLTEVIEP